MSEYLDKQSKKVVTAARRGEVYATVADEMLAVIRPWIISAAMMGAEDATAPILAMGLGFDVGLVNEAAIEWAKRHAAEQVTKIDATTRKAIQKHVVEWLESGDVVDELTRVLEPTFGPARAEMIAVTETTNALAGGAVEAGKDINRQFGVEVVEGKRWDVSRDEYVCPLCAPLDGQVVPLDGEFVVPSGPFEGRKFVAPAGHVRCRCSSSLVISKAVRRG